MEHHFDVGVAMEYGVIEAILINNFQYWINKNIANGTNFRDGRFWTYNSKSALQDLFPYLTYDKIRRALERLVDNGVLLTGRYSDDPRDRTLWYSLSDKFIDFWGKRPMQYLEMPDANGKNAQPLTNNKQQIENTYNITPLSPKGKSHKVLDLSFVDREDFIPIMEQWLAYKKEKGQTYKPTGLRTCYKKLVEYSNGNAEKAKQIIEEAMSNNYSGFFPLKQQSNGSNNRSNIQYGNPLYEGIVREMERNGITGF